MSAPAGKSGSSARFLGLLVATAVAGAACSLAQISSEYDAGGPPIDAGTEARGEAGGNPRPDASVGCGTASLFCDDFDDGRVASKWKTPPGDSGLSADGEKWVSSPYSLRVQCGNDRICHMLRQLPKTSRVLVEFDVLLVTSPPNGRGIWAFSFEKSDEFMVLKHDPAGMSFAICNEQRCWTDQHIGAPSDQFQHVRIEITFGDPGRVDVFVDGTRKVENANPTPRTDFETPVYYIGDAPQVAGALSEFVIDDFKVSDSF